MQQLKVGTGTDPGKRRENNEDCYLSLPEFGLWLVADGMGGHEAGEVASAIVKDTIADAIRNGEELGVAVQLAHHAVKDAAELKNLATGMGSTVVALKVSGVDYEIAWVGDSRAYLWDASADDEASEDSQPASKFTQITTDHSYVQMLYETGAISFSEMATHPSKNILTQSLGIAEGPDVNAEVISSRFKPGQCILLCSDGLTGELSDDDITEVFKQNNNADEQVIVDTLINNALEHGGRDNVTVEVIRAPDDGTIYKINKLQNILRQFWINPKLKITLLALLAATVLTSLYFIIYSF